MIPRRSFIATLLAAACFPVRAVLAQRTLFGVVGTLRPRKRISALESIDWNTLRTWESGHHIFCDNTMVACASVRALFKAVDGDGYEFRKVTGMSTFADEETLPYAREAAIEELREFCRLYDTDEAFRAEQDERYRRSLEDDEDE